MLHRFLRSLAAEVTSKGLLERKEVETTIAHTLLHVCATFLLRSLVV